MSVYTAAHTLIRSILFPTLQKQEAFFSPQGHRNCAQTLTLFQSLDASVLEAHLGLSEELLQFLLRQQAVILDKGGHLWGTLRLIVHRPVDLHVPVQDCQKFFLTLEHKQEGSKMN